MAQNYSGIYKYGRSLEKDDCTMFPYIPEKHRCEFVTETEDCDEEFLILPYMHLFGCSLSPDERYYFGIPIIILMLIFLFLVLSVTADMFFAPSLCAISDKLKMSENLAGVTLLAFGNASTDVITSIVEVEKQGLALVLSHHLGGGLFVLVLVAGIVILQGPFTVEPYELLRDVGFSIVAFVTVVVMCATERLKIVYGLILVFIYCAYVVCFAVENILRRKRIKKMAAKPEARRISEYTKFSQSAKARRISKVSMISRQMRRSTLAGLQGFSGSNLSPAASIRIIKTSTSPRGSPGGSPRVDQRGKPSLSPRISSGGLDRLQVPDQERTPSQEDFTEEIEREPVLVGSQVLPPPAVPRPRSVSSSNYTENVLKSERLRVLASSGREEQVEEEREGLSEAIGVEIDGNVYKVPEGLCRDFIHEISPLDEHEWKSSKCLGRTLIVTRMPIVFLLKFIIPTVNHAAFKNGWCKLLNCIHCVTTIIFLYFAFGAYNLPTYQMVTLSITLFVGSIATACLVYVTSVVNHPPVYHSAFAVLGFIASFSVIYLAAFELVNLLIAVGILLRIRVVTLGLTLMALGNNIGDMVADVALAKEGYSRMGFAGSFGATLFATLLGSGVAFLYAVAVNGGTYVFHFDDVEKGLLFNACFFIILALISYLLCVPTLGFLMIEPLGVYLVVMYVMFLGLVVLCEFNVTDSLWFEI